MDSTNKTIVVGNQFVINKKRFLTEDEESIDVGSKEEVRIGLNADYFVQVDQDDGTIRFQLQMRNTNEGNPIQMRDIAHSMMIGKNAFPQLKRIKGISGDHVRVERTSNGIKIINNRAQPTEVSINQYEYPIIEGSQRTNPDYGPVVTNQTSDENNDTLSFFPNSTWYTKTLASTESICAVGVLCAGKTK